MMFDKRDIFGHVENVTFTILGIFLFISFIYTIYHVAPIAWDLFNKILERI